jgi:UDP-N-acetylglucosamine 2-epimerase (non-hydrolysing)
MQRSEAGAIKILTVVGARPNFMKAAPIIAAINAHNERLVAGYAGRPEPQVETIRHILVHTGQHYDELMSGSFFNDLNLPKPDIHLGTGSGSHATQTAEIMKKFEEVLLGEKPDIVVVVGDVNSTLACALVTSKISFDSDGSRPVIAHVEAGLRSFDRSMPEEVNRILTDHVSDLLFVTEESGLQNLRNEGVSTDKIHFVGNTMIDSLLHFKEKAEASAILEKLGLLDQGRKNGEASSSTRYALLTLHRASNVDNRDVFLNIMAGLEELATDCPVVFPVHPRTRRRIAEFGFEFSLGKGAGKHKANEQGSGMIVTEPLGYLDFLCLMKHAALVVTDSGGIQEETTILGIPCVTVRENTERPVTVECGTNTIAGTKRDAIKNAIRRQLGGNRNHGVPKNWDGRAGERIIDILVRRHYEKTSFRSSLFPHTEPLEGRYACR